jgi:hypothetical protein
LILLEFSSFAVVTLVVAFFVIIVSEFLMPSLIGTLVWAGITKYLNWVVVKNQIFIYHSFDAQILTSGC